MNLCMRALMILTGLVIIAFGSVLSQILRISPWYFGSIGLFNILLGIITPKAPGITIPPNVAGPVKLIVDKAVVRANIYQLVFLDTKLVMKKLTSRNVTVGIGVILAILGGLVGGLTGFSLEEFLAQRKRDKIRRQNNLTMVGGGDIELPYDNVRQVQLTGTSLRMVAGGRPLALHFPGGYAQEMAPRLREIIPASCWVGGSVPRLSGSG